MKKGSSMSKRKVNKSKKSGKKASQVIKVKEMTHKDRVDDESIFKLVDLYFRQKNILYSHLHNSFNKFLDDDIKKILTEGDNIFFEKITQNKVIRYRFKYHNIAVTPPYIDVDDKYMFPSDARLRNLTYSSKVTATITQVQDIIDIHTKTKHSNTIGEPEHGVDIAVIPIMLRSNYCNLTTRRGMDKTECNYDPGGYFIVNGSEKVVMSLERMIDNRPLVFTKKDSSTLYYTVQVNSKSPKITGMTQIVTMRMKEDGVIMFRAPILSEVPAFIIFRALGLESDREIINCITYDETDTAMINKIRFSIEAAKNEGGRYIITQEDAIDYLVSKMRILKKYSDTDEAIKEKQRRMDLINQLRNNFLPHVQNNTRSKVQYLGYMVNKLLSCVIGRESPDDRDSYINKRIDLSGVLIGELFKQFYRKMLNECNRFFKKRNVDDRNPFNIINQIKSNIIEQGLKTALSTGMWGRKKGVAQMLERLSFMKTMSSLRRVNAPSADASTSKLTSPRHLHNSQPGFICVTGDTHILLADGINTKTIKEINESTDSVITVHKKSLIESKTKIKNYFSKMPDKLLKITTLSGRVLKCTPDHPILFNNYKKEKRSWRKAGKLKVSDRVIVRFTFDHLPVEEDTYLMVNSNNIPKKYQNQLRKMKLVDRVMTQKETEIIARIMGILIGNGGLHMNEEGECSGYIWAELEPDAMALVNDIMELGFGRPSRDLRWVNLSGSCSAYFLTIGQYPNTYTCKKRFPDWLRKANKRTKREYLSAFQSGKNKRLPKEDVQMSVLITFLVTNKEGLASTKKYMECVSDLYADFGIKSNILARLEPKPDTYSVSIEFEQSLDNVAQHVNNIGNRYNIISEKRSGMSAEYLRYLKYSISLGEIQMMGPDTFNGKYFERDGKVAIPIVSIEEIEPEPVYDFETISDNHSFVANGIVTHNCVAETPEGVKVGLVKNLTVISNISVDLSSQIHIIRNFLNPRIRDTDDVPFSMMHRYVKVFLNGEWIGVTKKAYPLYLELRKNKLTGVFDPNVGIVYDIEHAELRISTEGGRLYKPIFVVEDNEVLIKKKHIDMIDVSNLKNPTAITSWDQFLLKNPGLVEYIDVEEASYSMFATHPDKVYEEKQIMERSIKLAENMKKEDFDRVVNRYDEMTFKRYTHSDIHPALLIGIVVSNIPYLNSNQGPRNMFQYSQAMQGMCLYASNHKHRLDISYILSHPQRPVVYTKMMKYINTDKMPFGENAIVAIMCYTGYNQEDSIIINKSALDRGFFKVASVKRAISSIQKNQTTSQDDVFIKPDPQKVEGMKHGSYDKLNEKGYIPEETTIVNGDIVLAKISPIQPVGNSTKTFKDNSESYKSHVAGKVDAVYTGIINHEGYEMRKMRIRAERKPIVGDKFCCYDDSHEVLTLKGWVNITDITYTDKIACLMAGDTLEYHCPTDVMEYDYKGKMYVIESAQVSLKVTPNHRMYVGNRQGKNYKIKQAKDCYGKRWKYLKNVDNLELNMKKCPKELGLDKNNNVETFRFFKDDGTIGLEVDIEPWVEFFGVWLAEGCVTKMYRDGYLSTNISTHKQRVKESVQRCCDLMGIEIRKTNDKKYDEENGVKNRWYLLDKYVCRYLKPLSVGAINKYMPKWVWYLSMKQAKLLVHGMVLGDGTYMKGTTTRRYFTSSIKLRDDFQRLCLHAGFSANWYLKAPAGSKHLMKSTNGKKLDKPRVITTNADYYNLTVMETQNRPLVNKYITKDGKNRLDRWEDFNGTVYCCTVPGEGIIYVRRNGKSVWSGQSRSAQKGTVGITLAHADMPFTKDGITPDIIMNPNAFPSRMTMGQFIETLTGKVGVLKGTEVDGTGFQKLDLEKVKDELEAFGYNRHGYEYLYNGLTGQKMKAEIFIGPLYYMRLKHMVKDKMHCLTLDHEVLTESGWKKHGQMTMEDKVATLNDGKLEYVHPQKILYYPDYKGKIYHIETQQIDLNVTMEHRMLASFKRTRKHIWEDHKLYRVSQIKGKHVKYKKDAIWEKEDYQFILPSIVDGNNVKREEKKFNMDDWLFFFGFWMADGWTTTAKDKRWKNTISHKVQICQVKKKTRQMVIDVFNRLGYNPVAIKDKITVTDKQLYVYMKQWSKGAPFKTLPKWVWELSASQCQKLIASMILGDGSEDKKNVCRYYTSSNQLADDFMRLCLHAGWSCNRYTHIKKGTQTQIGGRTITTNYDVIRLGVVKTKNTPEVNHSHVKKQNAQTEEIIDYEGPVFCLQVPSEIFYVRRNGKPVWTGNSRSRGPRTQLTRQPLEGRARDGGLRSGEMERDTYLSHGMSKFLKERMFETSDAYSAYVCDKCGLFAQRRLKKDSPAYATKKDIFYCPACNNTTKVSKVMIPYACKLLFQELMAMNIAPRIRTKTDKYSTKSF